jgi:hypothetical protein
MQRTGMNKRRLQRKGNYIKCFGFVVWRKKEEQQNRGSIYRGAKPVNMMVA